MLGGRAVGERACLQHVLVQDAAQQARALPPPLLLHLLQGEEAAPSAGQVGRAGHRHQGHSHQRAT